MKKITIMLLLAASSTTSHAWPELDRQSYCANYGAMFQTIAAWRDQGSRPDHTLEMIRGLKGISVQEKKDAINTVYVDQAFSGARGTTLGDRMRQRCLAEK